MFDYHETLMDRITSSKALRVIVAVTFAFLLAIPSTLLSIPQQAYAASGSVDLIRDGWVNYDDYRTGRMMSSEGTPIYCAEPDKQAPPSGTYTKEELATVENPDSGKAYPEETIAAVLYYGWGGPGFDKSMWPDTYYDGSKMTDDDYWACTHIMIAQAYARKSGIATNNCSQEYKTWIYDNILRTNPNTGVVHEDNIFAQILNLRDDLPEGFYDSCYLVSTGNDNYQICAGYEPMGWIEIDKDSSNTDITDGNDCYNLEGAQYGIYRDSKCTDLVATLTVDANGYAKSDKLMAGKYYVKEITAGTGYALDTAVYETTVSGGQTTPVNGGKVYDIPQNDPAGIILGKFDGEYEYKGENNLPQGAASLAGAEFTVTYYDGQYSTAEEAGYKAANDAGEYTRQWVFATDSDGAILLSFAEDYYVSGDPLYYSKDGYATLPLGTFVVQETKAPDGYNLNDEIFVRNVTSEGTIESVETYNMPQVPDKVKRGDVEFVKTDENNQDRLANVAFLVTSNTTGESHVIVTDENGFFSSANSFNAHSNNTNGNDAALTNTGTEEEPNYQVDSSKLDNTAGIYFGMNANGEAVPQVTDEYGAFPYDTYTLQELPCDANQGLQLISTQFSVSRDNFTIDLGTIDDPTVYIHTTATDKVDGDKYIVADGNSIVVDTVVYEGAVKNHQYTLDTKLIDKTNNNTEIASVSTDFVAKKADDSIKIELPFDSTELAGHELTIVETLSSDGRVVATHNEELDESEQTVKIIPSDFDTTATDTLDEDKTVVIDTHSSITDTINTTNFIPGATYTAEGKVMRLVTAEDGTLSAEPFTVNGEEVTNTLEFEASAASESVDMTFEFDATEYVGQTIDLVIFETISKDGKVVATEEDPANANQQVQLIPSSIHTTATDKADGDHTVVADAKTTIVDTVDYDNLIPGHEYTMNGTLMVKKAIDGSKAEDAVSDFNDLLNTVAESVTGETSNIDVSDEALEFEGEPLLDADGNPITASITFTPKESYGSVALEFTFDSSLLAGEKLVAFESLTKDGIEVAVHADINDEGQTVEVVGPEIGTTLTDKTDGDHYILPSTETTLVDTIEYSNLEPGLEYKVTGTLQQKNEAGEPEPVLDAQGQEVTATTTFTPNEPNGIVELEFTFDSSQLPDGQAIVAFESVSKDGIEVAVHADINDENQTVWVGNPPQGDTFAKTGETILPWIIGIALCLIAAGSAATYAIRGRKKASENTSDSTTSSTSDQDE